MYEYTVSPQDLRILHPHVQPTIDQKYSEKVPESSKKQDKFAAC